MCYNVLRKNIVLRFRATVPGVSGWELYVSKGNMKGKNEGRYDAKASVLMNFIYLRYKRKSSLLKIRMDKNIHANILSY